jgi:hypothetical protein
LAARTRDPAARGTDWEFFSMKTYIPESATAPAQYSGNDMNIKLSITDESDIRVPFWLMAIVTSVLAAAPWVPSRFSLRTLLIATTLVAVLLGLIVWLSR